MNHFFFQSREKRNTGVNPPVFDPSCQYPGSNRSSVTFQPYGIEPITLHLRLAHVKIFGLQSYYFTANRWETMETVTDFIFLGSKITADGDCSHEIKRCLLLGRKAMTNLDSIFKSRDITLPTKVCLVKAMVLPVVMYGCERGTINKAQHRRTDAFKLWCWRRLLRVL